MLKTAGLPSGLSPHALRHTFVIRLIRGGAPLTYVHDLLGHSSTAVTADVALWTNVSGVVRSEDSRSSVPEISPAASTVRTERRPSADSSVTRPMEGPSDLDVTSRSGRPTV